MNDIMKMAPNRSKTYLLPLILEFFNLPENVSHNFLNCFVFDKDTIHENCIYLLYKYDIKNPNFTKFEYELSKNNGYMTHYDLKNNLILFVLQFPDEYIKEYHCYKNSEYSKYGTDAKEIILNYYKKRNIPQKVYIKIKNILYRSPVLKLEIEQMLGVKLSDDSELGEIVDDISETIDIFNNINNI